VIFFTLW